MRARIVSLLAVNLMAGVALGAASHWQVKDFQEWTVNDARRILADSPWAKPVPADANGRPSVTIIENGQNLASAPAASLGNPSNSTTGTNMSSPATSPNPAPGTQTSTHATAPALSGSELNPGAPEPAHVVTIIWASSTPVRLAVSKLRAKENALTAEQIQRARTEREDYVMAVVGLPPPGNSDVTKLSSQAALRVNGRRSLACTRSDYRRIGDADVYFFHFPKSETISTADQYAEFRLAFGAVRLARKFELSSMTFEGKLAL